MSGPRLRIAAALLFLAAAALAGFEPGDAGVHYRLFGLPEGIFALLLTYVVLLRGVWARPVEPLGWVAVGYGTLANAQLWELLLPPPGVVEWVTVTGLAIVFWGALGTGSRRRMIGSLGSLALLLALLKFSVIPVLWNRIGPPAGAAYGLGDLAEEARRFFADYTPTGAGAQLAGFAALCAWAAATRLLWPPEPVGQFAGELQPQND